MSIASAPFAALATNVSSALYSRSLPKTVENWEATALEITTSRFPFSGYRLDEELAESVRATASIAVYDAIHSVLGEGVGIFYQTRSGSGSPFAAEAAASQAAHDVLSAFFTDPVNQAELKLRLARKLATLPAIPSKAEGRAIGAASARAALEATHLLEEAAQHAA